MLVSARGSGLRREVMAETKVEDIAEVYKLVNDPQYNAMRLFLRIDLDHSEPVGATLRDADGGDDREYAELGGNTQRS